MTHNTNHPRMRRRPANYWILYARRSRDSYYGNVSDCACVSKCLHVQRQSPPYTS